MDFLDEELQTQHLFLIKRICRVCGEEKDLVADFYKCRKDSTLESSYSYECKECAKKRILNNYHTKSFKSLGTCVICNNNNVKIKKDKCSNCEKILKLVDNNVNILKSMVNYMQNLVVIYKHSAQVVLRECVSQKRVILFLRVII